MAESSVVIIGLPESGKTTFLAALWHLVTSREINTLLRFGGLRSGDQSHLNAIARRWRDAKVQDRTATGGNRLVSMNLLNTADESVQVTFPDVPGEAYQRMWEDRDCEPDIAEILSAQGVLLFIHADTIRAPHWVVDEMASNKRMGIPVEEMEPQPWHPQAAPTQVQIVDLLQLLTRPPLDIGPRKLSIMVSAWDKAEGEGLSPDAYVQQKLPLLAQYLRQGEEKWTYRIYGLSAQGGDYDPADEGTNTNLEAQRLRGLDSPSTRLKLVGPNEGVHDITEPLAWLMK